MSIGPVSEGYCFPTISPSSSKISYFLPNDVELQFLIKKSSRCFSNANSDGSSIVGSLEVILVSPFPINQAILIFQ